MTAAEPRDVAGRSGGVSRPAPARAALGSVPAQRDADAAVAALYAAHYRSLVGLAVLLVPDAGTAESVVQDSFVALHRGWRRLGNGSAGSDRALWYLRQAVVNRSRLARRRGARRDARPPGQEDGAAVLAAVHALPPRQREVLVLQHYAGLSAAQTARTLGTSTSAVRRRTARATASVRDALERAGTAGSTA